MRDLWVGVLAQAFDDIQKEPIGSHDYEEAVSFLTGGSDWAVSRTLIAECAEYHGDDIRAAARRLIAARRLAEGKPEKSYTPPVRRVRQQNLVPLPYR